MFHKYGAASLNFICKNAKTINLIVLRNKQTKMQLHDAHSDKCQLKQQELYI